MIDIDFSNKVPPRRYWFDRDILEEFRNFCDGDEEIPVRAFFFLTDPVSREACYERLMSYEEHVTVLTLVGLGYHRHAAMELAHQKIFDAHRGDIPSFLAWARGNNVEAACVQGSMQLGDSVWTVWRTKRPLEPSPSWLVFSLIEYDRADAQDFELPEFNIEEN